MRGEVFLFELASGGQRDPTQRVQASAALRAALGVPLGLALRGERWACRWG